MGNDDKNNQINYQINQQNNKLKTQLIVRVASDLSGVKKMAKEKCQLFI